jgi:plasmid maintenance system killer protein
MIATNIDKQITTLLTELSLQQKKTVLNVVKTFAHEHKEAWLNSDYEIEMNQRFSDLETGKDKGFTIQEAIADAKNAYKLKR